MERKVWPNPLPQNTKAPQHLKAGDEFVLITDNETDFLMNWHISHGFIIVDKSGAFARAYRITGHSLPRTVIAEFVAEAKEGEFFSDLRMEATIIDRSTPNLPMKEVA